MVKERLSTPGPKRNTPLFSLDLATSSKSAQKPTNRLITQEILETCADYEEFHARCEEIVHPKNPLDPPLIRKICRDCS